MIYLGIDPGLKGGMAILGGGDGPVKLIPSPTPLSVASGLDYEYFFGPPPYSISAAVECNHVDPKFGGKMQYWRSIFEVTGALKAWGIEPVEVAARTWQSALGITRMPSYCTGNTKNAALEYLNLCFKYPGLPPELFSKKGKYLDGLGDALCIALWLKAKTEREARLGTI